MAAGVAEALSEVAAAAEVGRKMMVAFNQGLDEWAQNKPAPRCEDYSWLYVDQCAHCLGHELPDDVPVQQS